MGIINTKAIESRALFPPWLALDGGSRERTQGEITPKGVSTKRLFRY